MKMSAYIIKRLGSGLIVLVAATILIFTLVSAFGNPLSKLEEQQPPPSKAVLESERERLGLNEPIPVRYLKWLGGVVRGEWGPSVNPTQNIGAELASRVGVSLQLVLIAMIISVVLAILVGTISAVRPHRVFDSVATPTAFLLLAMPSFWFAVLLKHGGILINAKSGSHVFATIGSPQGGVGIAERAQDFGAHIILPTITLALVHYGAWSRYHRTAMLDSLSADYVRAAALRGLSYRRVLWYATRPALIPIVTIVALDMPALFSGSVITEMVFQWHGMGQYLLQSIKRTDPNAIMAWFLLAAAGVVVFNLIADIVYGILDPRVRHG